MAKREHFLREAMTIAIPVALQAMLQSSFSMIDQLMVGQFGKTAIAAVEVGGKPQFVFAFVSGAIATVTGIMVSQYMGKNDQKKINTSMSVNLLVMLCLALFTILQKISALATPATSTAMTMGMATVTGMTPAQNNRIR